MAVPYIFAASTSAIPLANLDSNFAYFANAITVSSGNVGIGTNSPSQKLDVVGSNVVVKSSASSGYGSFYANGATGGQSHYFFGINSTETARIYSDAGNYLAFSTGSAATERMRIDSSGNVGIGVSSPVAKLDIISGTARMYFSNQSATAFFTAVNSSNSAYAPMAINGSELILKTGDAERARIDSIGRFCYNTAGAFSGGVQNIQIGTDSLNIGTTYRAFANGNWAIAFLNQSSSFVGQIAINAGSTTYSTSSDYRLKHDIAPMTGALAKVAALKPVTYKWNADNSDGEGFIAHELQEVAPYAVTGEKDGEQMQGVDYGKLTPILTAALQEAIAKIETLEARIAVLEAK